MIKLYIPMKHPFKSQKITRRCSGHSFVSKNLKEIEIVVTLIFLFSNFPTLKCSQFVLFCFNKVCSYKENVSLKEEFFISFFVSFPRILRNFKDDYVAEPTIPISSGLYSFAVVPNGRPIKSTCLCIEERINDLAKLPFSSLSVT